MINYFYNIKLKNEMFDFYSDVLTNIRKDYYLSKLKQKGKLTQNSDSDYISYEFSLEKDKMLKWIVSDNKSIISESKHKDDGKYCVDYYESNGSSKSLLFSKYHTLLKVEYKENKVSTSPNCTIEPRKNNDDLCLLMSRKSSYESTILLPMPFVEDEYVLEKIESEFEDYTAVASTNIGVVKFLSDDQLKLFEEFVSKAEAQKLIDTAEKSYIAEEDAELANMMNPKDFNIKKNLSQAIDITMAEEFTQDVEEVVAEIVGEDYSYDESSEPDFIDFIAECYNTRVSKQEETEVEEIEPSEIADEVEELDEAGFEAEVIDDEPVETEALSAENIVDVCDIADEPEVESFDVEQQEIPDCIIESSNTRYLYFGELDNNGKRNGYGRTASENGRTTYEGNYVDNKRDGIGAYYYKDGELCYYGEWKNNKRDGFGIGISSVDKSAHIGRFVANKSDGNGVRIDKDGEIRFVRKQLSDSTYVVVKFDSDKVILTKYSENGDVISENTTNMKYF